MNPLPGHTGTHTPAQAPAHTHTAVPTQTEAELEEQKSLEPGFCVLMPTWKCNNSTQKVFTFCYWPAGFKYLHVDMVCGLVGGWGFFCCCLVVFLLFFKFFFIFIFYFFIFLGLKKMT